MPWEGCGVHGAGRNTFENGEIIKEQMTRKYKAQTSKASGDTYYGGIKNQEFIAARFCATGSCTGTVNL